MQHCQNCGETVTDSYARVFAPPDIHGVRVCPACDDKIRVGSHVRKKHPLRDTK